MNLLDAERRFLEKRKRLVRSWRYVGPSLLCLIGVLGICLYVWHPLIANPAYVLSELQRGGIDQKTIELMAVILPILTGLLVFLCLVVVLFCYASIANERKYLEILAREASDAVQAPNNSLQARRL